MNAIVSAKLGLRLSFLILSSEIDFKQEREGGTEATAVETATKWTFEIGIDLVGGCFQFQF